MGINAGRYRFFSKLYDQPPQDDFSGKDRTPTYVRDMWVDLQPLSGNEANDNQQQASLNRYRAKTPWFPTRPNASQHFVTNGATYEIQDVINVGEMNEEYQMTAIRRENCA